MCIIFDYFFFPMGTDVELPGDKKGSRKNKKKETSGEEGGGKVQELIAQLSAAL